MAQLAGAFVELWEEYDGKGGAGRPMVAHGSRIKVKIGAGEQVQTTVAKEFSDQQHSNKAALISCVSKKFRFWGPCR